MTGARRLLPAAGDRQGTNPGADIRQGDLEQLPFADDSFDTVTSFNAVQYAADPVAALGEAAGCPPRCARRRARLGPGRTVPDKIDPCRHRRAAAPPPPPGAEGPFALSNPGRLEALAEAAGLQPDRVADASMSFQFPDLDTAVRAQLTSGPARMAIEQAGEQAVKDALAAAYIDSAQPDGSYRQENVFRYLIARA